MVHMVKKLPAMQETRFNPWVRKIPWRREWLPSILQVFLTAESHAQRSLVGYSSWLTKSRTRLSDWHTRRMAFSQHPTMWSSFASKTSSGWPLPSIFLPTFCSGWLKYLHEDWSFLYSSRPPSFSLSPHQNCPYLTVMLWRTIGFF